MPNNHRIFKIILCVTVLLTAYAGVQLLHFSSRTLNSVVVQNINRVQDDTEKIIGWIDTYLEDSSDYSAIRLIEMSNEYAKNWADARFACREYALNMRKILHKKNLCYDSIVIPLYEIDQKGNPYSEGSYQIMRGYELFSVSLEMWVRAGERPDNSPELKEYLKRAKKQLERLVPITYEYLLSSLKTNDSANDTTALFYEMSVKVHEFSKEFMYTMDYSKLQQ